jgi:hypothetical protein
MKEKTARPSKNKALKVVGILAALLLVLGLGLWANKSQQTKIKQRDDKITELQKQVDELSKESAKQEQVSNSSSSESSVGSSSKNDSSGSDNRAPSVSYLDIKEFKLKLELDENTKDAYYVIRNYTKEDGSAGRLADLSTRTLVQKDPICSAENGSSGGITEQGAFIYPQALCSDNESLTNLEQKTASSFSKARIIKY